MGGGGIILQKNQENCVCVLSSMASKPIDSLLFVQQLKYCYLPMYSVHNVSQKSRKTDIMESNNGFLTWRQQRTGRESDLFLSQSAGKEVALSFSIILFLNTDYNRLTVTAIWYCFYITSMLNITQQCYGITPTGE